MKGSKWKHLTKGEIEKINELYDQGLSKKRIGEILGRPTETIRQHTPKVVQKMQDPENIKEMLRLRGEGLSQYEIAEKMQVSQGTINKYLNRHLPNEPKKKKAIISSAFVTPLNTPFF